jgi:hypothetical protein
VSRAVPCCCIRWCSGHTCVLLQCDSQRFESIARVIQSFPFFLNIGARFLKEFTCAHYDSFFGGRKSLLNYATVWFENRCQVQDSLFAWMRALRFTSSHRLASSCRGDAPAGVSSPLTPSFPPW